VWTMHDSWCFTGACHHPYEGCNRYHEQCGKCPYFHHGTRVHDMSWRTWHRKHDLYKDINIQFVAVSNWLAANARSSSLLADKTITVIPNAFPVEGFHPYPVSGIKLPDGIDTGKRLILMGAARLDDPIKGIDYAIDALNRLATDDPELTSQSQAVFFGNLRDSTKLNRLKFPYVHIGMLRSATILSQLYASATAVLSTSLYESLPTTLIEGQAAGCLPVTFGQGGQSDIVTHLSDGYIAKFPDTNDIATGLKWALTANTDRKALHAGVNARFAGSVIAARYISLFDSLLKRH
ncbi:MAG: glycosyltransferase, partial [Muribaculaceae bacterium]|nr:glycosyltransferase [Muribaculaceae bacterium]